MRDNALKHAERSCTAGETGLSIGESPALGVSDSWGWGRAEGMEHSHTRQQTITADFLPGHEIAKAG